MLRLTQDNLIENFVQDCPFYIPKTNGLCSTTLAYPKWLYICLKVNMCIITNKILTGCDTGAE